MVSRLPFWARLALSAALMAGCALASAATLHVPQQYHTVADAYAHAQAGDEINLGPGTFAVNLYLDKQVIFQGAGATRTVLMAASGNATVTVPVGGTAQLRDLAVTNGFSDYGGGVSNAGVLTMERCVIAQCAATVAGGGLANLGNANATLTDCVLSGNDAPKGGGVYNARTLVLNRCTLMDNQATKAGGGLYNANSATLKSVTISGNSAEMGGGLYVESGVAATLNNATIVDNDASASSGGIKNDGTVFFTNSILAGNVAPAGPDGSGPLQYPSGSGLTFDLIQNISGITSNLNGGGNILNQSPSLGGLSYNTDMRAFFPTELFAGAAGVADADFTGAPDEAFAGLGSTSVIYDFGANVILNEPGQDLNVYEVDYGAEEFAAMDILVSVDGVNYVSVKPTEGPLVHVPGDAAHGLDAFSRSYDLSPARLPFVRYVKIQGTGVGPAGGTNGFDLDAVAAIRTALVPVPTPAHLPLSDSPVIDAGGWDMEVVDQRGILRNQDGDGNGGVEADMGAVEVQRVYVVTNTNDTGAGSLRAALATNSALGIGDGRITFKIPGPGPYVIRPLSALATERPVVIDGWSQTGFSGTPLIEIDGSNAPASVNGLYLRAQGCVVRGLSIHGFGSSDAYGIVCSAGVATGLTKSWLYGNAVGVTGDGAQADPNDSGILIAESGYMIGSNLDGVNDDAEANVISGNAKYGVFVVSSGGSISGNRIGADVAGRAPIPNGRSGIALVAGSGNAIRQNRIAFNNGLGIDISGNGVTANDSQDADGGPNNGQNFPVITRSARNLTSTRVTGALSSVPNTDYTIEFFENGVPDPTGYGQGQRYLGSTLVTTRADGNADFEVDVAPSTIGTYVTATATAPDGSTSEFSRAFAPAYRIQDAVLALKLAGGLAASNPLDVVQLGFGEPQVTMGSAIRIARKVAGTDANP